MISKYFAASVAIASLTAVALPVAAAPRADKTDAATSEVRTALAKHSPDLVVEKVSASPASGLFHVVIGGTSGYITRDGRYFIPGDLLDVVARKNLTEDVRKTERLALLEAVRPQDRIVFAASKPQHSITVFTDVDCGFCRKLHGEIGKLNELGITVNYVAFPRSGPGSDSWAKMQNVWCSSDRGAQLTRAKLGEAIAKPANCEATPVQAQFELGERLGVQGTPTIILEDGSLIGGYVPADQLHQQLAQQ